MVLQLLHYCLCKQNCTKCIFLSTHTLLDPAHWLSRLSPVVKSLLLAGIGQATHSRLWPVEYVPIKCTWFMKASDDLYKRAKPHSAKGSKKPFVWNNLHVTNSLRWMTFISAHWMLPWFKTQVRFRLIWVKSHLGLINVHPYHLITHIYHVKKISISKQFKPIKLGQEKQLL